MSEPQPDPRVVDQVRRYAAASVPPYGSGEGVFAEVTRRRRRRAVLASVAAAAVVIGASFGVASLLRDGPTPAPAPAGPDRTSETQQVPVGGDWRPMATSPLSPRHASLGVWTGREMVVVGGRTGFICPPNADCATDGDASAEAAAYDPATDSWRMLPAAPATVDSLGWDSGYGERIAWSGAEVVVVKGDNLYALDPDGGDWQRRRITDAPDGTVATWRPGLILEASYSKGKRVDARTDWVLDPATGIRTWLPADPFGESYDRSIAWLDGRFWLLSMGVARHFGAWEPTPSRLAVLEDGTWRVVAEETPGVTYGQRLYADGDRLVIAPWRGADGHWYDPATQAWGTLPAEPMAPGEEAPCPIPSAGLGPQWIAAADGVLIAGAAGPQAAGGSAVLSGVPRCDRTFTQAAVAVWAGDELLVWGGAARDADATVKRWWQVTAAGLRWRPPTP